MHPADDSGLLRRYAENNSEEAFAALVERHVNLVYSVALRQAGNPHYAEDITQIVFILLAKKAARLRHERALSSWLFQATRLTARNFVRSETRRHRREMEAYMQSVLDQAGAESWPRIAPLLDAAVAALRKKDRQAILLRFYEGRNLREVGAALGASEVAAEKRVNRAVEKLRKFFIKRGVASTGTVIASAMASHSVQAAPAGLAKAVTSVAIGKGAAVSASSLTLIKGALKIMAWTKAKTAAVAGIVVVLAAGTATVALKHNGPRSSTKLSPTPANIEAFTLQSNKLVGEAKMATLSCELYAQDHQNLLPGSFANLNGYWDKQKPLSDADWKFIASGDKGSFKNPDKTIYFMERVPRERPDGQFVRVYATVNGRVFLVVSPEKDFSSVEKQRGFLIGAG